jgi:hypothetical protein
MCEYATPQKNKVNPESVYPAVRTFDISNLMSISRFLCEEEGLRRTAVGFIGYSGAQKGDKVLIAVDSHYDPRIAETIAAALREKGAKVDIVVVDVGPDSQELLAHESPALGGGPVDRGTG